MATKRARRATRRSATTRIDATDADALLSHALSAGAVAFLSLRDITSVLNACRALRFDADLALLGLAHTAIGAHFLRRCVRDWSATRPSFLAAPEILEDTECDVHNVTSLDDDDTDVPRLREALGPALDARRGQATALLSALAMAEERLVPLCYKTQEINGYGDICTARPVVLPLPLRLAAHDLSYKFTRDHIHVALDECFHGIGELVTSTPASYTHVSDFGAHWEPTTVTTAVVPSGTRSRGFTTTATSVSCGLCDAAQQAIKTYRKDARAALRRFNDVLKDRKEEWKAEGCDADEIHQRRSELKAEFFPEDCYPDINFAEGQDDAILADICESGKFPMNPFEGQFAGFDRFDDDVFNALREEYVELCGSLVQPLKRVLTEECGALVGRRVFCPWMGDDDGSVRGELVAGVTTSGMLVGVYVITRRVE